MSVQEVENMTLAQKRMAAMIMETTAEEIEAQRARQAAAEAEAAAAVGTAGTAGEDDAMEESDDEDKEVQDKKKREEEERQRELDLAREKVFEREEGRARKRERESGLPRLSILRGASLTPPDTVPPTPLSPLKEGEHYSACAMDLLVDFPRRVRTCIARRRVCSLRQRVWNQSVQAGFEDVYR